VEEQDTWMIQTPVKSSDEQDERLASIEKAQADTSTLVTTLTDALGKTRMECSKVLVKANIAIEDSRRAVNALVKHLAALDEEIVAYEKIVENSESAASYLEAQVKKIAEHIAKLSNVPPSEMEIMMKMLAETAAKMKSHEEEAQASKEELTKARARRLKAGKESELAQAKLMAQANGGKATRLVLPNQDQEMQEGQTAEEKVSSNENLTTDEEGDAKMQEARNKREREENNEGQGREKRSVTPVQTSQQGQTAEVEESSDEKQTTEEEKESAMDEEL
jgi:hypothetical protein